MTALKDMPISFPGLFGAWEWNPDPIAIHIGHGVYWYGIILAFAMLCGVWLSMKAAKRCGLEEEYILDLVLFAAPCCVIGSRIYYVVFNLDLYRNQDGGIDIGRAIAVWDGGIAIYGTVIAGTLVALIYAARKKIPFGALADAAIPGLMLGQVIGRWANLINREAFGGLTNLPWRMRLWISAAESVDVHPTFFYESVWNAIGLIILFTRVFPKRKFDGENACFYFLWYGLGRAWIEGLRTDSLYLFDSTIFGRPVRVSQAFGLLTALIAACVLYIRIWVRRDSPSYLYVNRNRGNSGNIRRNMADPEAARREMEARNAARYGMPRGDADETRRDLEQSQSGGGQEARRGNRRDDEPDGRRGADESDRDRNKSDGRRNAREDGNGRENAGRNEERPERPARNGAGNDNNMNDENNNKNPAVRMDGKPVAEQVKQGVRAGIELLPRPANLAVILVGDDPASNVYVTAKERDCKECGIRSRTYRLSGATTQENLLRLIDSLNSDRDVDGILLQLPLPKHLDTAMILEAIDPDKDVDCFHPYNIGRLWSGSPEFLPCTPIGVMALLKAYKVPIAGKRCVILGRSNIVGKPMAALLSAADGTVTICHSRTENLNAITREADILISAVGQANFVTGDMIHPGAAVVDVGINRDKNGKLCGDADYASMEYRAGWISPVPGGVGLLTRAMLMENILYAARRNLGVDG